MAKAIIMGIYNAKLSVNVIAYDIDSSKVLKLSEYNVRSVGLEELAIESDYLILAVKPNILAEAVLAIRDEFDLNKVIISIVAATNRTKLDSLFNATTRSVIVMPNTGIMIGHGTTAIGIPPENLSKSDFDFVCSIFSSASDVHLVNEDSICNVIPVNGSSPAYVYNFSKGFIDYGNANGIDSDTARQMIASTLIGCARMLLDTDIPIDELISMVCSKGGTTIAGLERMKELGFDQALLSGLTFCRDRAIDMQSMV